MSESLIVGIKGVAKYLNVSTTRAHAYMKGEQRILPEPAHTTNGESYKYRCYNKEQLEPVKELLGLPGKIEVIKAALQYRTTMNILQEENANLKSELEKVTQMLNNTRAKYEISTEVCLFKPKSLKETPEGVDEIKQALAVESSETQSEKNPVRELNNTPKLVLNNS